ncbi:MAG: LysR substrate-binding domain-containing protein [Alphaproteobacteria bacterium]|nr:LysR substrate-binding domain-containing protein [Alphaproteobacteria bacterium]
MLETPELRFFATVATSASLAAAARMLNVSPPAVSQRLRQIEQRLGFRLVERSRGHLTLTMEGESLLRNSEPILHALERLNENMRSQRREVTGPLKIIAPFGFGRMHVAPAIAELVGAHPNLAPELALSDDPYGAARTESWDLIIHVGKLSDTNLTQKKLASNRRLLCASPDYLAKNDRPLNPDDLQNHACGVVREDQADATLWTLTGPHGERHTQRIRPAFASNNGEIIKSWAVAGMGIVLRSEWNVAAELVDGRLERVLENYALPDADIVALLNSRTLRSARTRYAVEALASRISSHSWL